MRRSCCWNVSYYKERCWNGDVVWAVALGYIGVAACKSSGNVVFKDWLLALDHLACLYFFFLPAVSLFTFCKGGDMTCSSSAVYSNGDSMFICTLSYLPTLPTFLIARVFSPALISSIRLAVTTVSESFSESSLTTSISLPESSFALSEFSYDLYCWDNSLYTTVFGLYITSSPSYLDGLLVAAILLELLFFIPGDIWYCTTWMSFFCRPIGLAAWVWPDF